MIRFCPENSLLALLLLAWFHFRIAVRYVCLIFVSSVSVTRSLISTLVFSSKEELFLGIHKTSKHDEYCLSKFFSITDEAELVSIFLEGEQTNLTCRQS